jgi:hypothetical protein
MTAEPYKNAYNECRTSEQIMVDLIKADLGVTIEPQAWRMFLRARWDQIHGPAHRIHEGKR